MNDLISRKTLLKEIIEFCGCVPRLDGKNGGYIYVDNAIAQQPTAYDVDKVIVNLMNSTYIDEEKCYFIPEEAIEIVKRGGQE